MVSRDEDNYQYYIKVEIYGYSLECHTTLNISASTSLTNTSKTNIDGPTAWCASDSIKNPYFHISFAKPIVMSGIMLQGDSTADNWVKGFTLSYGLDVKEMKKMNQLYIGNSHRIFPLSVNWLTEYRLVKELIIYPKTWTGKCCLRFAIRGCEQVLSNPYSLSLYQIDSWINVKWKQPVHLPIPITNYTIQVTTTKPYNQSFYYSFNATVDVPGYIVKDLYVASSYTFTIYAYVQSVYRTVTGSIFVRPLDPPEPLLNVKIDSNRFSQRNTTLQFYHVSDIHGPISCYQVIISTKILDHVTMKNVTLLNQEDANNLPYYLAAEVKAEKLFTNSYQSYVITEGEETVPGLNVKLPTIGIFHIYIRAVIFKKDVEKYVAVNTDYFGNASSYKLERESLKKPTFVPGLHGDILLLVKGPINTKSYQIIIMKVNDTTVKFNSTSSYRKFKSYRDAIINEPFLAAEFPASQYEHMKNFSLGNKSYNLQIFYGESFKIPSYYNGRLESRKTYALFQRVVLFDGTTYSSPWLSILTSGVDVSDKANMKTNNADIKLIAGVTTAGIVVLVLVTTTKISLTRKKNKSKEKEKSDEQFNQHENNMASNYSELQLEDIRNDVYTSVDTRKHMENLSEEGHYYNEAENIYEVSNADNEKCVYKENADETEHTNNTQKQFVADYEVIDKRPF